MYCMLFSSAWNTSHIHAHQYQTSNHFIWLDWGFQNTQRILTIHTHIWKCKSKKFKNRNSSLQTCHFPVWYHFFFFFFWCVDQLKLCFCHSIFTLAVRLTVDICKWKPLNKIQWLYFVTSFDFSIWIVLSFLLLVRIFTSWFIVFHPPSRSLLPLLWNSFFSSSLLSRL